MIKGIIVALPDELSSLTNQRIKKGDCFFINDDTIICLSGAGSENATTASQKLISKGATKLISWGCAAALSANLKPGDLVIPNLIVSPTKNKIVLNSPCLDLFLEQLSGFNPNREPLTESLEIIASSAEKKSIFNQTQAVALDMESYAVATIAQQHNLPAIIIRCIADPVDMDLPAAVSSSLNQQGDVEITQLLKHLFFHPTELPSLIQLGLHFSAARKKLKLIAKHLDLIN